MSPLGTSLAAVLMAALAGVPLQDPEPPNDVGHAAEVEDVHARMRALLLEIEQGLRDVDDALWRMNGPRSVLREATDRAQRVVDDIDLLLEIAHHPHPGAGGGT
jgi:hypothetical protein